MDKKNAKKIRPPIATLMGHVDHGKTTLLDTIRKTNIVSRESGGITQHIGAYQIEFQNQKITFIDTPGHAAFEKMRFRGADIADIIILVVASTESVKPQTKEAIKHIKKVGKPVIIAATKSDLPEKNIDKVKSDLQKEEIIVEQFGGQTPLVEISAKEGKGIDELLEVIILIWQLSPVDSLPNNSLQAIVVESFIDKNRGPVATLIVKVGTLKVGQKLQIANDTISVRALIDDLGNNVQEAEPGKPIEVLGFKKTLEVGSKVYEKTDDIKTEIKKPITIEELIAKTEKARDRFNVIIKADVLGSLEAIINNLPEKISVLVSSVGDISANDTNFAKISNSPILAFNVKIPPSVKSQAQRENIIIKEYKVIYELLDDLESLADSFSQAKHESKIIGKAKIITTFNIEGKNIAGSSVIFGKIKVGDNVIVRNKEGSGKETKVVSIKKYKKDIQSVSKGEECGILLSPEIDFTEGYIIESMG